MLSVFIVAVDADGDHVRCRWADGQAGGITKPDTSVLSIHYVSLILTKQQASAREMSKIATKLLKKR